MTININLEKIVKFARKHKEALAVAGVAILVTHKQTKAFKSMSTFIISNGLEDEYCHFMKK